MNTFQSCTLKNGLKIIHMPVDSRVSYCGFIVKVGTRDESTNEYGMAHFIEHMLFKGTHKRRSFHILNRMESVGGDINAYTNKEETVIYSTFLNEDYERAFELLTDLTFHSTFPQQEIDKEIEVILDEINSYEDNPSELIYDEFENIVFANSQLGHNILGEPDILNKFDTKNSHSFFKKHYSPENIVFFSVSNISMKKLCRLADKYLSEIESFSSTYKRTPPSELLAVSHTLEKDTNQAHAMLGGRCYNLHSNNKMVLYLLNNILGGPGMNSRLNVSLREKRGYVYHVESNVTNYEDTGLFSVYFGCDKSRTNKCIELICKEFKNLKDTKLTTLQLSVAKKQILGQMIISRDNHESLALGLGKSFLHYNHFNNIAEISEKINNISAENILDVANEIFADKNIWHLIYN